MEHSGIYPLVRFLIIILLVLLAVKNRPARSKKRGALDRD